MHSLFVSSISILLLGCISFDSSAQAIDSLAFVEGVTILFDSAEDQLSSDDIARIDSLATSHSSISTLYRIEGHTDDVGSIEYNNTLAAKRANSVRSYLTENRLVDTSNIFTDSYGELKPAQSNLQHKRKYNRRVDLSVYTQSRMRKISGVVRLDSLDTTTIAKVLVKGKDFLDSTYTVANGNWSLLAPDSTFVQLDISAPNYFFSSKRIKVTQALDKRIIDLKLPKLTIGKVYDMPDFYFKGNQPILVPSSEPTLKLLFETMSTSDVCIHIKGHVNHPNAPPVDKSHRYYTLSKARAKMVFDYLKDKGIDTQRMQHNGYGNWKMKYPNAKNEAAMQKNRRVEIEIVECNKK